jgi:hypothetical protein
MIEDGLLRLVKRLQRQCVVIDIVLTLITRLMTRNAQGVSWPCLSLTAEGERLAAKVVFSAHPSPCDAPSRPTRQ